MLKNSVRAVAVFVCLIMTAACDSLSTEPGSFVVLFQWETGHEPDTASKDYYMWAYYQEWKGGEGKTFPADIENNAKSLDEAGPVKLGSGDDLTFTKLTYGNSRFVRAAIWDNAARTGDPLYVGVSELFNFSASDRNKAVAVNMKLQANAGVDETGQAGSFAIEVRHDGAAAERVGQPAVTLRLTVKNADTVIIANDLNFEKGVVEKKLSELTKIDETTYELADWDITEGWTDLGDALYSVFGKSRNTLGYESAPKRADVYLDTTAPVPNVTPFPELAKIGDTITVRFSFDEDVAPASLDIDWGGLAFELADNKANKSYTYTYQVSDTDAEQLYTFTLTAVDGVGNETAAVTLGVVTIDRTLPSIGDITVAGTDGKETLRSGDTLTVSFTASEDLAADPVVKIDDKTLTLDTKEDLDYAYTYTVTGADISGIKTITASLRDLAGNDATVGVGQTVFDNILPQLMGVETTPARAKKGVPIEAVLSFSEPVDPSKVILTAVFDDDPTKEIVFALTGPSVDNQSFSFGHTVDDLDLEGPYTIRVDAADSAGNEIAEDQKEVGETVIDKTAPTISDLTITGIDPLIPVKGGTAFTVAFTLSEEIKPESLLEIGKLQVRLDAETCQKNGLDYTCDHIVDAAEGDGTKNVAVAAVDLAGNLTRLSYADPVIYDTTAPDIVNPVIAPEKANLGATVDVRFSFTEDVEGVAIDWGALDGLFARDPDNEGNKRLFIYKRQITATDPEDSFPITVTAATDMAGNPIAGVIPLGSLEIDRTAPGASPSSVAVNGDTGKSLAKEEDIVTITFTVAEEIQEHRVRIGLIEVPDCTFDTDLQRYTCTHKVQRSDGEGSKDVTVELKDVAGNADSYAVGQVTFDMTAAELANKIILPTKSNKSTAQVEVKFSFTEEVVLTEIAAVNNNNDVLGLVTTDDAGDCPLNGAPRRDFICAHPFDTDDTQVNEYPVTVSATDRAGNPAEALSVGTVSIDRDVPFFTAQDVTPNTLNLGGQFTISFTSSETLEGDPIVKVGALQLGAPTTHDGNDYTYVHYAGAEEGDGDKLISVTITDPAGNGRTIDLIKTVTYDTTAPVLLNPTVSPETANIQADAIDVRFSFPEDVEAVTLTGLKLSGDAPDTHFFTCAEQGSAKSWKCTVSLIAISWEIAEYELWVNGRDLAGNYINPDDKDNGQMLGLNAVIDRKRPVISGTVTQCTGLNCAIPKSPSKAGDRVRVEFEVDETPVDEPLVLIAGRKATTTACPGPATYNYCIVVQEGPDGDADGEKEVRIESTDEAGNISVKTLAVKPRFDVTAPAVLNPVLTPNPSAATSVPTLAFNLSEPILPANVSVTSTSGQVIPFTCTTTADNLNYACSRPITVADGAGYTVIVNATDAAGNSLEDYNAGELDIDRDMPGVVLTLATPTTLNLSVNTLTIQFEVNETPAADPILRIGADTITTLPIIDDISGGKSYTYTIPITHAESEGIKKATAEVYDAAGNHYYAELTYALGGSPDLIYDFTVPRVITRSASPERANLTTQGIQILTSFSEPVQKPSIGTVQVQKRVGANWVTQSGMASRVSVEDRAVGYTHALYFSMLDMLNTNDGEYRIHMQVTDENGNTAVTQSADLLNLGEFRIDMTLPVIDTAASIAAICTEPTDLNPGETDYCTRPGHIDKAKAKAGDTIYYRLVFNRSDPYYEFDDIVDVWPTIEVSGLGAPLSLLSQITYPGDVAPYTFIYRRKIALGVDTEDVSSYALISMQDTAGNTYRKLSDDPVRTDVTQPTLVASAVAPAYAKLDTQIVVNFTLSEPVTNVSFNGAGLAFAGGCTTTDNISYRCAHTVASGDTAGTKNFTATATDATGNTSATLTLGSTVIDKTAPSVTISAFSLTTTTTIDGLPAASHAQPNIAISFRISPTSQFAGSPVVQFGGAVMSTLSCSGTTYYDCSGTYAVPAGETAEGTKSVTVTVTDAAGNVATQTPGSVIYDFSPPRAVSTIVERIPDLASARNNGTKTLTYTMKDPYTRAYVQATMHVLADEEVTTSFQPVLYDITVPASPTVFSRLSYVSTTTDDVYFSKTFDSSFTAGGPYTLGIVWEDKLGNRNSTPIALDWKLAFSTTAPTSPDVTTANNVIYTRIPWGNDETNGIKDFQVAIKKTALASDAAVVIFDGSNVETAGQIGKLTFDAKAFQEGNTDTYYRMTLSRVDRQEVYIAAVNSVGNLSDALSGTTGIQAAQVKDIVWVVTMHDKVRDSTFENPHLYTYTGIFSPSLEQHPLYTLEMSEDGLYDLGSIDGGGDAYARATGKWLRRDISVYPDSQNIVYKTAYDTVRGVVVAYGHAGSLWEYGFLGWQKKMDYAYDCTELTCPASGGNSNGLAFDSSRGKTIFYTGNSKRELWEWDGTAWEKMNNGAASDPGMLNDGATAYDPIRKKTVFFGGDTFQRDTWEWDGISWTKTIAQTTCTATNCPSARKGSAMVYDESLKKILLFGGEDAGGVYKNDTWGYGRWGTPTCSSVTALCWKDLNPPTSPTPARSFAGLTYDPVRGRTVLFGGYNAGGYSNYRDTWEFDGTTWTNKTPTCSDTTCPAARYNAAMTFDPVSKRVLLLGGKYYYYDGTDEFEEDYNDMWYWDGSTWAKQYYNCSIYDDATCPRARLNDAAAYDQNRKKMVIYGGGYTNTWEWDGNLWTRTTTTGPVGKDDGAMVYDSSRTRIVYYGGISGGYEHDTWEYRLWGTPTCATASVPCWSKVIDDPALNPPARWRHAMVYDSSRNVTVLFGGASGSGYLRDTWEYNGTWTKKADTSCTAPCYSCTSTNCPTAASYIAMAYDANLAKTILFGGQTGTTTSLRDTWTWDGTVWTKVKAGTSCTDTTCPPSSYGGTMAYDSVRKKTVLYSGYGTGVGQIQDVWEWDGVNVQWVKRLSAADCFGMTCPRATSGLKMVYDTSRKAMVLFGGDYQNYVWEWNGDTDKTPANIMTVDFGEATNLPHQLTGIDASWVMGGTGYSGANCTAVNGAMLYVWHDARRNGDWVNVAGNTAPAGGPTTASFSTVDPWLMNHMVYQSGRKLAFAATPVSANGCGVPKSTIVVDYAELTVKYTLDTSRTLSDPGVNLKYTVGASPVDLTNARSNCDSAGGKKLVVIDNELEQYYLEQLLELNKSYWTGYSDATTEGTWLWTDGTTGWIGTADGAPYRFNNWLPGYPNNTISTYDYGLILANNNFRWRNYPSTFSAYYICE